MHISGPLTHARTISKKKGKEVFLGPGYLLLLHDFIKFWLRNQKLLNRFTIHVTNPLHQRMIYQNAQRRVSQVSNFNSSYFLLWVLLLRFQQLDRLFVFCSFSSVLKHPVKPRKGDALLFFSLHPSAIPDPSSLHGGCPVIEGEKWSATKWIHVDSFDKIVGSAGGNCTDSNGNCERWAALGECTNNPEYMVGTPELPGNCRRSCKIC